MEDILLIDFETRSKHNISNPLYNESADTQALCMSFGMMGADACELWWADIPEVDVSATELPQWVIEHVDAGGYIGASNAAFDRGIWNNICVEDYDFPETMGAQWICTQAQARVAGLPSKLDKAAQAAGVPFRKHKRGTELIKLCSIPPYSRDMQDYIDLGNYCLQDWAVMNAVACSIPELSENCLWHYHLNESINNRGIRVDVELARAASFYADAERDDINAELAEVTCGAVQKVTQHAKFATWLRECLEDDGAHDAVKLMVRHVNGKKKYSSDKNVRANLQAAAQTEEIILSADVVEALELMDDGGGSATSKFGKMVKLAHPDDGRVRGAIRYAGAPSTQRYSSMGLQLHNFRRDAFTPAEAEHYRAQMLNAQDLTDMNGEPVRVMDTLGKLLRSAIIPKAGSVFVVGDWSSIESRMTAWLADDQDKLDLFRRGDDAYCYAATAIYGKEITPADKAERQVGKVSELACGFLGGPGALAQMAAQYRIYIDPDERQNIVDSWREKHPKILKLGNDLMLAAGNAIQHPDKMFTTHGVTYEFSSDDGALYCDLPDGETTLRYPEARIEMKPAPWDAKKLIPNITSLKAAFTPKADAEEWPRHSLWRGLTVENVVQALCASLLRRAVARCLATGLPVAFHVHDEIILEVPADRAQEAKQKLQEFMETASDWCKGLPLTAEPEIMERYGK